MKNNYDPTDEELEAMKPALAELHPQVPGVSFLKNGAWPSYDVEGCGCADEDACPDVFRCKRNTERDTYREHHTDKRLPNWKTAYRMYLKKKFS